MSTVGCNMKISSWNPSIFTCSTLWQSVNVPLHVTLCEMVVNQAYSRLSTTHGHITDCKLDSVVDVGVCVWVNVSFIWVNESFILHYYSTSYNCFCVTKHSIHHSGISLKFPGTVGRGEVSLLCGCNPKVLFRELLAPSFDRPPVLHFGEPSYQA